MMDEISRKTPCSGPRPTAAAWRGARAAAGMTLLELMVAASFLAITAVGLLSTLHSSMELDTQSWQRTLAMNAAREQLETIRLTGFAQQYTAFNGATFTVAGLQAPLNQPAGEIVMITDEGAIGANYGRDLNGDGQPDGVRLPNFSMDLNGNGVATDGDISGSQVIMPVGAVVSWVGINGETQRVELWTLTTSF